MRVLTIIHLYPPYHVGGYEMACKGAMERFVEHGHDAQVLTGDHRFPGVEDMASKVSVRRELQGWWDWEAWEPAHLGFAERARRERHNEQALGRAVDEFKPDVASIWNLGMTSWTLGTMLEKRRVPVVLTFLDDWVTFANTFDAWSRIFDRRPWARPIGALLGLETRLPRWDGALSSAASLSIAQAIERTGRWKFPGAPIIPIGVDTDDFPVTTPRDGPWGWNILYVGRVVPAKGVHTAVRALALLPPSAHLDVVGHAHESQRRAVEELADSLGVAERVRFDVATSRQDLRRRYLDADVLVFPSEWPEPFGIVPLEAMACGTPVVATGTGGSGEFLDGGENCLLFEAGNPTALAEALVALAGDAGLRRRLTAGGTRTASTLTMHRFADELEQLHVQAVARHSKV